MVPVVLVCALTFLPVCVTCEEIILRELGNSDDYREVVV